MHHKIANRALPGKTAMRYLKGPRDDSRNQNLSGHPPSPFPPSFHLQCEACCLLTTLMKLTFGHPLFRTTQSPLSTIRIVASIDGQQYRVVDLTGAKDGTWIRQRIFHKVFRQIFTCGAKTHAHFGIVVNTSTAAKVVLYLPLGSWLLCPW